MKAYSQFSLFQSHLDLAHTYWKQSLKPGDIVIDATCGNGHDTLELATILFHQEHSEKIEGRLLAFDLQKNAIEATKTRLQENLPEQFMKHVHFFEQCHSSFPEEIVKESVALIVYNLGYLPGGDKTLTTACSTTLQSLKSALTLVKSRGCISITCYPGHEEGHREESLILDFLKELSPREWSCCHHSWLNRRQSPSLLIIQKAIKH